MAEAQAIRTSVLKPVSGGSGAATLTPAAPASRISLRAGGDALKALSKALGLTLPEVPQASASKDGRTALWLGPDEWLVIDEDGADLMALCAGVKQLHSAVDISHRNTAIIVKGSMAAEAINAGCPMNLSGAAFPVGNCARTVLGKAEIVLHRTAEDEFRVECWRSFATFVLGLLSEGARDVAV
jgi:sarcosine oxidase, subunit gamma